ncbi:type II toxin-antitoxin system death-on-curing family toxin [Phycicoccus sp. Soil803]|uniref:type II toxin-antitoxin system death-on-curing family toxin n=1 Tax=Phycicoccus sp. Soil803 TaxID=1736415 RepID=UPI00070FC26D|nr:type II toxin-antitoxin system death-on-curing family toxin [Phycicoccus sp. Soil803]KRF26313.1 alcohol dehydrogenase [Phycicoccus sp. Soil803]
MADPRFLDVEDLLALIRDLGAGPVRDLGLLDAAAARPRASLYGEDAYGPLELKGAALLQSLVRNHALVDGNKRIGFLACLVLLDINGVEVDVTDDEAFALVMDVATGDADLAEIVERLGLESG